MVKKTNNSEVNKNTIFSCILSLKNKKKKNEVINVSNINKIKESLIYSIDNTHKNVFNQDNLDFNIQENHKNRPTKVSSRRRKIYFDLNKLETIVLDSNEFLSLKEIKHKYQQLYPESKFCLETLRKYLQRECNIYFKSINIVNNKSINTSADDLICIYSEELSKLINQKHIIMYCDESSFNETNLRKKILNNGLKRKVLSNKGRIKSISAMAVISVKGVEHFKLTDSTFKGDDFIDFMNELEDKITKIPEYNEFFYNNRITVICDNARIHTMKKNIKKLKKLKLNILFQPPYSPQVNAIELLWALIKKQKNKRIMKTM